MFRKERLAKQKRQRAEARRTWQREELINKLERAEHGQLSLYQLDSIEEIDLELLSAEECMRWQTVYDKLWAERFSHELAWLQRCQNNYRYHIAPGSSEKLDALCNFYGTYQGVSERNLQHLEQELGVNRTKVFQLLEAAVQAYYDELLLEREDSKKFFELRKLIERTRLEDYKGDLRDYGIKRLPYPPDWNDLVARHYETPSIGSFRDLPDRGPGDVRLLAAQALKDDDFTQAQIALSYCNSNPNIRVAVGDVLTAELAKLVTRHRAEVIQNSN